MNKKNVEHRLRASYNATKCGINIKAGNNMSDTRCNQKLLVPLFGVQVETPLSFTITEAQFVERLTAYLFPQPIPINTGEKPPEHNEPVPVPIPVPKTIVRLIPWSRDGSANKETNKLILSEELPEGFDLFDNLGPVALRAGPGGLGGFQTITTLSSERNATALLLIEFDQVYPQIAAPLLSSTNPYESNLVESMLDGMRLFSGQEPHPYKGFHTTDGKVVDMVIKWPLMEIQGGPLKVGLLNSSDIEKAFYQVWQIRTRARQNTSCEIVTLAMEYYYLSSTMTETRTIFLYLMIAFEALFKTKDEDSASAASSRLARLLADSKSQYNEIRRFMWDTKKTPGCCQLRNEIVHGNTSSLKAETYWKLRGLLRIAILRIMHLVLTGKIDQNSYYESISNFVNQRFDKLPNL